MKINTKGTFTWFGYIMGFEDKLGLIKRSGFDAVCTWWGDDFKELDGDYRLHPELADKFGLEVESAHIPYLGAEYLWFDKLDGEDLLKKYKKDITDAASSGIDTLVMHPFEKFRPAKGSEKLCIERLRRLGDVCDKYAVKLAVENLADNETLSGLLRKMDNPYIGMCFDTGHNNIVSHNDYSLLEEFGAKLFALHVHDNNSQKDQHLTPYEGNIDWISLMDALGKTSYERSFMLESCYPFDFDSCCENDGISVPQGMSAQAYLEKSYDAVARVFEEYRNSLS